MTANILELRDAHVHYGKACALEGVSVDLRAGAATGLFGRNGAGKTTLLSALMGLHPITRGSCRFEGVEISTEKSYRLARAGIALVPADRQIYGGLTVAENLRLSRLSRRKGTWSEAKVFELFPRLRERRAALAENLSGGEKQMLAIGRALLTNPRLLLLDEPTEGLAPLLVKEVVEAMAAALREGVSILVVEQNLHAMGMLLEDAYVLESGVISWQGRASQLLDDLALRQSLLSV
jgi:branched-chain amino acid transport system ATP-binding protein